MKVRVHIFISLMLSILSMLPLFAQRDSLLMVYKSAASKKEKLESLDKLVVHYIFESIDFEKGEPYAKELLALATKMDDTLKIGRAYNALGTYWQKMAAYDKSITHYEQALSYAQAIKNYRFSTTLLNNIANSYFEKNDVTKSYRARIAAFEMSKKCDCPDAKSVAAFSLGYFYLETLQDYKTAIYWQNESLKYAPEEKFNTPLSLYYLLIAHLKSNQLDSARHYSNLALASCERVNRKDILAWILSVQGIVEAEQGHFDEALKNTQKAVEVATKVDTFSLIQAYYGLGYTYYKTNDYINAQKIISKAENLIVNSPEMTHSPLSLDVYDLLVKLESDNNPKKALTYLKKVTDIRDNINQAIFDTRSDVFAFQSNIVLQETENKRLQLENEKNSQTTKFLQIILISILSFVIILFYFYQKIRRQNTALKDLTHRMEHFCNTLSHDALGYINQIIGFTNFAQISMDTDEKRLMNQKVLQTASRLKKMSKNLIEFNQTGNVPHITTVSLDYILVEVKQDMEAEFVNNEKKLTIQENLPVIKADREFTKQIFRNLISNAAKFGKPDQTLIIEVSAKRKKDFVEISVRDNGIGISKDNLPFLFNEFTKVVSNTEGSGLGLYICKQFVEKMGGRIWVESELGIGSTFYFTLLI